MPPKSFTTGSVTRLPFVPILVAFFFGGSVFLIFTLPLIIATFAQSAYATFDALVSTALISFWKNALAATPAATLVFAAAFFSVVFGFLLKPIDQLSVVACVQVARTIGPILGTSTPSDVARLFSPSRFADAEHVAFMSWLLKNKEAKAHWEWEFFLYQIHWGLCTNVILFVSFAAYLLRSSTSVLQFGGYALLGVLTVVAYGLARSLVMGNVQEFYEKAVAKNTPLPPLEASAPKSPGRRKKVNEV